MNKNQMVDLYAELYGTVANHEGMSYIFLMDVYVDLLPGAMKYEKKSVSTSELLEAWALRIPDIERHLGFDKNGFDIEKAVSDFIRKVAGILKPCGAKAFEHSVDTLVIDRNSEKGKMADALIERVKNIDVRRFLKNYRDDGWVTDSNINVVYRPDQWGDILKAMYRDEISVEIDNPLFLTKQQMYDMAAEQYRKVHDGLDWVPIHKAAEGPFSDYPDIIASMR